MITAILSGGIGSRFWPMSTNNNPKQFIEIYNGNSLFSLTLDRISSLENNKILAITNKNYEKFLTKYENVTPLFEPFARNTFGAVLLTVKYLIENKIDDTILFLPSDHLIKNTTLFIEDIENAIKISKEKNILITFGTTPKYAETGYGYIRTSRLVEDTINLYGVKGFKEKPDLQLANYYLMSDKYFWSCGISVFNVELFLFELKNSQYAYLYDDLVTLSFDDWLLKFENIPNIPFEKAIIENCRNIAMIKIKFDWSDVGSWQSYFESLNNNYDKSNVVFIDSSDINVLTDKKTILIGLDDITVVNCDEGLLIMKNGYDQKLKDAFLLFKDKK